MKLAWSHSEVRVEPGHDHGGEERAESRLCFDKTKQKLIAD